MSDEAPKSAYELAMARLKKQDADDGTVEAPLSDAQRAAIAEVRQVYAARRAQAEIMLTAALATALRRRDADPAQRGVPARHRSDGAASSRRRSPRSGGASPAQLTRRSRQVCR